jgi:hypothetical protein
MWIPIGNVRHDEYLYKYNKELPKKKFKQGERNTCATSSLASVLYTIGLFDSAKWLEEFGKTQTDYDVKDGLITLQTIIDAIFHASTDITKTFQIRKMDVKTFDIYKDTTPNNPKLLRICGSDGSCSHAITIHNSLIYDSNLEHAVVINKANLEYCADAVFDGVIFGYEFVWIEKKKTVSKSKKRRKMMKKMLVSKTL